MNKELLTHKELAAWLKIAEATVRRWTLQGMPCVRMGRLVRYEQDSVLAWVMAQPVRLPGRRSEKEAGLSTPPA